MKTGMIIVLLIGQKINDQNGILSNEPLPIFGWPQFPSTSEAKRMSDQLFDMCDRIAETKEYQNGDSYLRTVRNKTYTAMLIYSDVSRMQNVWEEKERTRRYFQGEILRRIGLKAFMEGSLPMPNQWGIIE